MSHWMCNLDPNIFDIAAFYYGNDLATFEAKFGGWVSHKFFGRGMKMQCLKEYAPQLQLSSYASVWAIDDDITIDCVLNIPRTLQKMAEYNLNVISPAHDDSGYISHHVMRPVSGDHYIRYVNFVEMTCPIFEANFLINILPGIPDEQVSWGNDWLYSYQSFKDNVLGMAIDDSILARNPLWSEKTGNYREVDLGGDESYQFNLWETLRAKTDISYYEPGSLGVVPNGV